MNRRKALSLVEIPSLYDLVLLRHIGAPFCAILRECGATRQGRRDLGLRLNSMFSYATVYIRVTHFENPKTAHSCLIRQF